MQPWRRFAEHLASAVEPATKWANRCFGFAEAGDRELLADRSRGPLHGSTAVDEAVGDLVIRARKARPHSGPRKLRVWKRRRRVHIAVHEAVCAVRSAQRGLRSIFFVVSATRNGHTKRSISVHRPQRKYKR
jgi:hypothetical protein